jgi:hypothetical protein
MEFFCLEDILLHKGQQLIHISKSFKIWKDIIFWGINYIRFKQIIRFWIKETEIGIRLASL